MQGLTEVELTTPAQLALYLPRSPYISLGGAPLVALVDERSELRGRGELHLGEPLHVRPQLGVAPDLEVLRGRLVREG